MIKQPLNTFSALVIWDDGFDISMSDILFATAPPKKAGHKKTLLNLLISDLMTPSVPGEEEKEKGHSTHMYVSGSSKFSLKWNKLNLAALQVHFMKTLKANIT